MSASGIGWLRLDEWFAIEDTVLIENAPALLDQLVEPQVEGAVEIPKICLFQAFKGPDWVSHAGRNSVIASTIRTIRAGTL